MQLRKRFEKAYDRLEVNDALNGLVRNGFIEERSQSVHEGIQLLSLEDESTTYLFLREA